MIVEKNHQTGIFARLTVAMLSTFKNTCSFLLGDTRKPICIIGKEEEIHSPKTDRYYEKKRLVFPWY